MRILIANVDKVLVEYRSSHWRRFIKKCLWKCRKFHWKKSVLESVCNNFFKNRLKHRCFLVKYSKILSPIFEEHLSVNDCFWEYFKRSYWTPPQGFCILMNVYRLFKFLPWTVYPSMLHFNKSKAMLLPYI